MALSCGGSSGPSTPTPAPTPQPAAAITAVGAGTLIIHPSADVRFAFALEAPVRITETAGGTCDWNFARISFFMNEIELGRYELTADDIRAAGFSRIAPRSSDVYNVIFRTNQDTFDRVDITLGFGDIRDGRRFTAAVPPESFSDVAESLTPLSVPGSGTVRLGATED
jgi:hypothetical protein